MAALVSPVASSSSLCWFSRNDPSHSSSRPTVQSCQGLSGRQCKVRQFELAKPRPCAGFRGSPRRSTVKCLAEEPSGGEQEGGFMFKPPPGTPLVGSGAGSPDSNPEDSLADGKGSEKGQASPLSRAAAYKQANQKKAPSGALSAMEKAKAYRTRSAPGAPPPPSATAKPFSKELEAPAVLPPVEIVTGKSFVSNVRRSVVDQGEAGPSGIATENTPTAREQTAQPAASTGPEGQSKAAGAGSGSTSGDATLAASSSVDARPEKDQRQGDGSSPDQPSGTVLLGSLLSKKDYELQQAEMVAALRGASDSKAESEAGSESGSVGGMAQEQSRAAASPSAEAPSRPSMEVEIFTRDGIIRRKVSKPSEMFGSFDKLNRSSGISSKDFIGLDFGDKKDSRSVPAGLTAPMDMPPGALPEVEIITGGSASQQAAGSTDEALYKPKVATWGVFPRPKDISRSYGGGRTIRPGESLETPEDKAAREAKTRRLLEEYRRAAGFDLDPKTEAECDAAMAAGSQLMDKGRLTEAVGEFDTIIEKTVFKHALHGKAMLQKAVCLDSMARPQDARALYEKLMSHSDGVLRQKARQMLFGFEAAESLRVRGGLTYDTNAYRRYFDAFADGYNTTYKASKEDGNDDVLQQVLPYTILLVFPIVLVVAAATLKGAT